MSQNLARYHARSPRYILNTEDDNLIRVAGPQQLSWEEGTQIKNVSLTGLVFTAAEDLCPLLGEVIRIQFVAPGERQMACHAIVTRLEEGPAGIMLVAVHFHRMEMAHRIALAQGLARRFREQLSKKGRQDLEENAFWRLLPSSFMMMVSLWLWGILTVIITSGEQQGLFSGLRRFFGF